MHFSGGFQCITASTGVTHWVPSKPLETPGELHARDYGALSGVFRRLHQTHRWLVGSFSSLRIFGYSLLNNARRLNPVFRGGSIRSAVPAGQVPLADRLSAECRWRFSGTLEPFTEFAGCVNAPTLDSAVRIFRGDQHLS